MAGGFARGQCPLCGSEYRCRADSDGLMRRCEACGQKFRVAVTAEKAGPGCVSQLVAVCAFIILIIVGMGWFSKRFPSAPPEPPKPAKSTPSALTPITPAISAAPATATSTQPTRDARADQIAMLEKKIESAAGEVSAATRAVDMALDVDTKYRDAQRKITAAEERAKNPIYQAEADQAAAKARVEATSIRADRLSKDARLNAAMSAERKARAELDRFKLAK